MAKDLPKGTDSSGAKDVDLSKIDIDEKLEGEQEHDLTDDDLEDDDEEG